MPQTPLPKCWVKGCRKAGAVQIKPVPPLFGEVVDVCLPHGVLFLSRDLEAPRRAALERYREKQITTKIPPLGNVFALSELTWLLGCVQAADIAEMLRNGKSRDDVLNLARDVSYGVVARSSPEYDSRVGRVP